MRLGFGVRGLAEHNDRAPAAPREQAAESHVEQKTGAELSNETWKAAGSNTASDRAQNTADQHLPNLELADNKNNNTAQSSGDKKNQHGNNSVSDRNNSSDASKNSVENNERGDAKKNPADRSEGAAGKNQAEKKELPDPSGFKMPEINKDTARPTANKDGSVTYESRRTDDSTDSLTFKNINSTEITGKGHTNADGSFSEVSKVERTIRDGDKELSITGVNQTSGTDKGKGTESSISHTKFDDNSSKTISVDKANGKETLQETDSNGKLVKQLHTDTKYDAREGTTSVTTTDDIAMRYDKEVTGLDGRMQRRESGALNGSDYRIQQRSKDGKTIDTEIKDQSGKIEKSTREAPQTPFGEKVETLLSNFPEISEKDRATMVKGADLLNTQSPETKNRILKEMDQEGTQSMLEHSGHSEHLFHKVEHVAEGSHLTGGAMEVTAKALHNNPELIKKITESSHAVVKGLEGAASKVATPLFVALSGVQAKMQAEQGDIGGAVGTVAKAGGALALAALAPEVALAVGAYQIMAPEKAPDYKATTPFGQEIQKQYAFAPLSTEDRNYIKRAADFQSEDPSKTSQETYKQRINDYVKNAIKTRPYVSGSGWFSH